jgi:hypothetical protein
MLILGLLGMYFNAAVIFVRKSSLLFKFAVAILCVYCSIKAVLSVEFPTRIKIFNDSEQPGTVST